MLVQQMPGGRTWTAAAVPPPAASVAAVAAGRVRRPAATTTGIQRCAIPAACQQLCCRSSLQPKQAWRWQRRRQVRAWAAAAGGSGAASSNGSSGQQGEGEGDGDDEGPPPTAEEIAEAQRALQDFLEGMGAAGEASRPKDFNLPEGKLTYAEALALVGMSGWRVAAKVCPEIEELTSQMEGIWRSVLPEDQFGLYELGERYKYLDSLDPEGQDPLAFMSRQDPPKGVPGYPRLQVENRAYWSRAFRKMHIEVAVRQDGLQVFHCVMYPRLTFDLPILSMDLVANNGRVSLAVVDPCPVSAGLDLPPFFEQAVRELQARYELESNREVPEWGSAIFSRLCIIMRPTSGEELGRFLKYALALTQMHTQIAKIAHPVTASGGAAASRRIAALHAAHRRYCDKQLENDKTRRVLEAAFGSQLAEAYMREVMFDCEPLPGDAAAAAQ